MSEKVEVEARGANVEAAIEAGLSKMGMSRNDVIVEVVDEGSRGLLGIGARDAVVRLTGMRRTPPPKPKPKPAPPKPAPKKPEPVPAETAAPAAPAAETAVSTLEKPPEPIKEAAAPAGDAPVSDQETDAEEAKVAQDLLREMLDKMLVNAAIEVKQSEPDDLTGRRVNILDIQGEDLTILIGTRGETLDSMQYILRLMVGHRLQRRATFVVDVQGYRQRRELALARLAERMAKKALSRKQPISLEPMPPYERRIIHMALRDHTGVYTESTSEGKRRKVQILPK